MRLEQNQIILGDRPATMVAKQYGTPVYVYEESVIRDNYQKIADSLVYSHWAIHYAIMANNRQPVLLTMKDLGAAIQVNSVQEWRTAQAAGFTAAQTSVTTTNISTDDLLVCGQAGLLINFDSLEELEKYGRLHRSQGFPNHKVGVRYAVRQTPTAQATNQPGEKRRVGVRQSQMEAFLAVASDYDLKVVSIHGYLASNMLELEPFMQVAQDLADQAKHLPDLELINFGGGFGVPAKPGDKPFDFSALGRYLSEIGEELSTFFKRDIGLRLEPGRSLVAEAGTLLTRVTNIKDCGDWTEVGCDAGFGVLARPLLYGWRESGYHPIYLADKVASKTTREYTICANSTLQNDFIGEDRLLPELKEGDILAVANTGAYGAVMASGFPGKGRPEEIFITVDHQVIEIHQED